MPIYEFNCAKCGKLSEVVQRVSDRSPPCPYCGSKRMTRAVSRTSFHLKGGGWYADLYATPRPGSEKAEKAEKAEVVEPAKSPGEKPAAAAKPEGGEKPSTPPAGAPVTKPEAAKEGGPPRRRPSSPRKRR